MKVGDKVTLLVHGAGTVSKEKAIIKEIGENYLKIKDRDSIFKKKKDGSYRTDIETFSFWFEIK